MAPKTITKPATSKKTSSTAKKTFNINKHQLELYSNCSRCFYVNTKLGISLPEQTGVANDAVNKVLKRECNHYRLFALKPPILKQYSLDAIPFFHEKINEWQDSVNGGIKFHHPESNLIVAGAIDDLWVNSSNEIIVVDYKASTMKNTSLSKAKWLKTCQRQLDVYAWLLQKNDFNVHEVGYFLYCDRNPKQKNLDTTVNFDVSLIPHEINTDWIEDTLVKAAKCLNHKSIPAFTKNCQLCHFLEKLDKTSNLKSSSCT